MEAIFRIELKTKGYKALVLPLNYIAKLVSRGFEPLNAYLLRSNAGTLNYLGSAPETMDRDTGFEPAPSAWKAEMLAANTNPG